MGPISVEMYAWRKVKAKLRDQLLVYLYLLVVLMHSLNLQNMLMMIITLDEQLIQFFGATVLLTFSFTDKDGDGYMSIVYVQQACNIIGLQKSWRIAALMTMAME
ncbi:hypothetical protein NC653_040558 [Populus alba x Populus x berolinensis]|uniref:Uncharacterized protein n=1 Tax=Populus alba x Populus x berolinensis TaxID=444605 RepID=A0AAD6L6F1_9ROSI|nr:hypothetical protein NC653_040558 [Populus alba x Populus x berolinensis]